MDKLTKNRMTYLLAHYEGVVAGRRLDVGDARGAQPLFANAINKYEHMASINDGEERMSMLNEALKLARRSGDNVKTYRLLNTISRLIMNPDSGMTYVEIGPVEVNMQPIRNAIMKTYSNEIYGSLSYYVYRVELDRDGFGRLAVLFDDSELGTLIADARGKYLGDSGVQVTDEQVMGVIIRFEYNHSGYLEISSKHSAQHHTYVENVINVYGTAMDRIVSGLNTLQRLEKFSKT